MIDGNTRALKIHLSGEEQQEIATESFLEEIEAELNTLESIIADLKGMAKNYIYKNCEYDFSEELESAIDEII